MASIQEIVQNVLNLGENEFFAADRSVLAPRESRLLDMDFSGVAINAPTRIVTSRHQKLPLIMATGSSGDRDWDVNLKLNCMLVGSNLLDGTVRVTNALVTEKELTSRSGRVLRPRGAKPPGLAAAAAQLTEIDARQQLNLEWSPGVWALGILYFDWPSNTVVVQLEDGGSPEQAHVERSVAPPLPIKTEDVLPNYFRTADTPAPPESGLVFRAGYSTKGDRQSLVVHGAFALPLKEWYAPLEDIVHDFPDGRRTRVRAIVPLTLTLLRLDGVWPWQFDWAIPVYDEISPEGTARGFFSIDALASGEELDAGSYVCYMIADGRTFGPGMFQV